MIQKFSIIITTHSGYTVPLGILDRLFIISINFTFYVANCPMHVVAMVTAIAMHSITEHLPIHTTALTLKVLAIIKFHL